MAATLRLAGLLQAHALIAELPAVEAAANAVLFHTSIEQARASMPAARVEQPRLAALVPEQDQVFAEAPDELRKRRGLRG